MKIAIRRKNKVIGFIKYRSVGKPKHRLVEITRIEVDKKYRRQGIATELFNRFLKKVKFRKLFLTSHSSNTTAHIFYNKMGMKSEAILKNHYYEGEDELIYNIFRK